MNTDPTPIKLDIIKAAINQAGSMEYEPNGIGIYDDEFKEFIWIDLSSEYDKKRLERILTK